MKTIQKSVGQLPTFLNHIFRGYWFFELCMFSQYFQNVILCLTPFRVPIIFFVVPLYVKFLSSLFAYQIFSSSFLICILGTTCQKHFFPYIPCFVFSGFFGSVVYFPIILINCWPLSYKFSWTHSLLFVLLEC